MWKLSDETIKQIQSSDWSAREVARNLWVSADSVIKYRKQLWEALVKPEKKTKEERDAKIKSDLVKTYTPEELRDILQHLQTTTSKSIEKIINDKGHLKFALLGDTHIGNKQSAKKELADFYKRAGDAGVDAFIHCGDLVDWSWHVFKWQVYELENVWYDEQLKTVVNDYPYYGDVKTYMLGGNHDEDFLKQTWANIIKNISTLRDDIIDMWFYDARIKLNWVDINAHHGWGSMSYAKSYKPQKLIENIDTRNQPDVFASGHWHDALYMSYRNIHSFLVWSFLKQNLLAKRFNLGTVIWWWIVEANLKDDWSSEIEMKFIEY